MSWETQSRWAGTAISNHHFYQMESICAWDFCNSFSNFVLFCKNAFALLSLVALLEDVLQIWLCPDDVVQFGLWLCLCLCLCLCGSAIYTYSTPVIQILWLLQHFHHSIIGYEDTIDHWRISLTRFLWMVEAILNYYIQSSYTYSMHVYDEDCM